MAPTRPKPKDKKSSARDAAASQPGIFSDDFRTNKKDKRLIKHSIFLAKIEKSRKKNPKRRRPSKKLVANLDSLVDALPDIGGGLAAIDTSQVAVIKQRSLKHRPGAMKRKEKLDKLERERFSKNLAQMAAGLGSLSQPMDTTVDAEASAPNRWAALRSFIAQTIDQNPEFKPKEP